jgi:hypothetical protein
MCYSTAVVPPTVSLRIRSKPQLFLLDIQLCQQRIQRISLRCYLRPLLLCQYHAFHYARARSNRARKTIEFRLTTYLRRQAFRQTKGYLPMMCIALYSIHPLLSSSSMQERDTDLSLQTPPLTTSHPDMAVAMGCRVITL